MARPVIVSDIEERRATLEPVEFREADQPTLSGYAALFQKETVIGGLWGWREVIASGAFTEALERPDDVRALFNHNPDILLGRTKSGTLTLGIDKKGLNYQVDLPDTASARDVRTLIKRGDVTGSSFAFRVEEDEWDDSEVKKGKLPLRTITKVELFDVSPVTYPAYPQTSVTARSKAQAALEQIPSSDGPPSIDAEAVAVRAEARAAVERARAWVPPSATAS